MRSGILIFWSYHMVQLEVVPEDAGLGFLIDIKKHFLLYMLSPQYVIPFCEVHCLFNLPLLI